MNTYYYETSHGHKGRIQRETDHKAKEYFKHFGGVKVWREEEQPHKLTLIMDQKRETRPNTPGRRKRFF